MSFDDVMKKKYQVELTGRQMQAISLACELFTRLRIGQFEDILWKVFPEIYGKGKDLELIRALLDRASSEIRGVSSNQSSRSEWSESSEITWDVHQTLRYKIAWDAKPGGDFMNVHFDSPLRTSSEPLVKIRSSERQERILNEIFQNIEDNDLREKLQGATAWDGFNNVYNRPSTSSQVEEPDQFQHKNLSRRK